MSKMYYQKENELKKALITKDVNGITVLTKKIFSKLNDDSEILNVIIHPEIEIGCGRVDILAFVESRSVDSRYLDIHVFELKRGDINLTAVGQVLRYSSHIESNLEEDELIHYLKGSYELNIYSHLIGTEFSCFNYDNKYIMNRLMNEENIYAHQYHLDPHSGLELKSWINVDIDEYESTSNFKDAIGNFSKELIERI